MEIRHEHVYPIVMPSLAQMSELQKIATASLFPKLELSGADETAFRAAFIASFRFAVTLRHVDDLKERVDTWTSRCGNYWQDAGQPIDIPLAPFLAAVVASGAPYRYNPEEWPHNIYCGLSWSAGRPATTEAWRQVISSRKIRASIPAPGSPYPEPPRPTIQQLDRVHGMGAKPFE
jgi:hypothetical protein